MESRRKRNGRRGFPGRPSGDWSGSSISSSDGPPTARRCPRDPSGSTRRRRC